MKSVYNTLKEPVINYIKKDVIKEGIKSVGVLTQKVDSLKIEDRISIGLDKLDNLQTFTYKPTFLQEKTINNFNSDKYINQFEFKKIGLNNVISRGFSSKVDRMEKFADPTNDVAFKKVFSEDNIKGLQNFIESIIVNVKDYPFSLKLESIEFLNKDQMPSIIQGKRSLCDLKVKDDIGNTYIIEMQKRNEEDYLERIQYYSAHAVVDQLEQGQTHSKINPIITISIMGRNCFENDVPCISYHPYKETTTNKQLLLMQSHIFIELPKLNNSNFKDDTLEWLNMFKQAPALDKLPSIKNEYVVKAYQKLERHNWTREEMDAYIDAKVFDDMEKSNIEHAINKGIEKGIEKGENKKAIEMAKKMLLKDKPIEEIIEFTGLTKDQILSIK